MTALPEPVWFALLDDEIAQPLPADTSSRPSPHPAVRALVVRDTDLPLLRGSTAPLHVVVTGGAGQVAGPAALGARLGLALVGLEVALRDTDDLAGNARRVVAAVDVARAEGALDEDLPVHVGLPADDPTHGWLAAADEVAAAELRLTLLPGGVSAAVLATWIDAALDRETPFRTGGDGAGPLPLLAATRLAFDGAGRDEVVAALESRDAAAPATTDLTGVRRWVTAVGTPDVAATLADLRSRGLVP